MWAKLAKQRRQTELGCEWRGARQGDPGGYRVASDLPQKIIDQMSTAGLPSTGQHPFTPRLTTNKKGEQIIEKNAVAKGPKKGKRGYVDNQGRIWGKDRSHAGLPDHWDVQIDDGEEYIRVDQDGNELPGSRVAQEGRVRTEQKS